MWIPSSRAPLSRKVFKAEVSPDGHARDELDVACAVNHPNLTKAIGIVRVKNSRGSGSGAGTASDDCSINNKQWLVMERVEGQPLADKPDFTSVLRCRWGAGRRFEPVLVLAVLLQVGLTLVLTRRMFVISHQESPPRGLSFIALSALRIRGIFLSLPFSKRLLRWRGRCPTCTRRASATGTCTPTTCWWTARRARLCCATSAPAFSTRTFRRGATVTAVRWKGRRFERSGSWRGTWHVAASVASGFCRCNHL